jgi:acetamidase/formamidase
MQEVSKSVQNTHLTIDRRHNPVATICPGEEVIVETTDYLGDILDDSTRLEDVLRTDKLDDNINPVTGPLYIDGAEPGDALEVEILDIELPDRGVINTLPGFGGLEPSIGDLGSPSDPETVFCDINDGTVTYPREETPNIHFPVHPQVGTIGTAEKHEGRYSIKPHENGGNMDCRDVTEGNTLYLPVDVDGGCLFLGDCHAAQGDGEICGISVEVSAKVHLRIDTVADADLSWPRIESADEIMSVAAARPAEDAVAHAYVDLIEWLVADYGFTEIEAYHLCSAVGRVQLAQIVNPKFTVAAKFPKRLL